MSVVLNTNSLNVSTTKELDKVKNFRVQCSEPFTVEETAPLCRRWNKAFVGTTEIPINDPYNFSYTFPSVNEAKLLRLYHISDKVAVTVTGGENGTVTKEGEHQICRGNDFSFNYTPQDGYKVDFIRVNGVLQTFTKEGGTFTSKNIQDAQFIEVGFIQTTVTITVNVQGSGTSNKTGANLVQIGSTFSVTFTPNLGGVITLISDSKTGNISIADPASAYTYNASNIQENRTITATFMTIKQSLGYIAYPKNLFLHPIAFRNNGFEIWKTVRKDDNPTEYHNQGFGLDNAVTAMQFWEGTTLNSLSSVVNFTSVQTDYRADLQSDATNQYHKLKVSRADGGYFEANGRAERKLEPFERNVNTRSVRVFLHNVANGKLIFKVISGASDNSGTPNFGSVILTMKVNGQAQSVANKYGTQDIQVSNLNTGTHTVEVTMQISGESDVFYCKGTYVIN